MLNNSKIPSKHIGSRDKETYYRRVSIKVAQFIDTMRTQKRVFGNFMRVIPTGLKAAFSEISQKETQIQLCKYVLYVYTDSVAHNRRKQVPGQPRPIVGELAAEHILHQSFAFMMLYTYDVPYVPFLKLSDAVARAAPALQFAIPCNTCLQIATDLLLMYFEECGYFQQLKLNSCFWHYRCHEFEFEPTVTRFNQANAVLQTLKLWKDDTFDKSETLNINVVVIMLGEAYLTGLMQLCNMGRLTLSRHALLNELDWQYVLCQRVSSDQFLRMAQVLQGRITGTNTLGVCGIQLTQNELMMCAYEAWRVNYGRLCCIAPVLHLTLEVVIGRCLDKVLDHVAPVEVLQHALLQGFGCGFCSSYACKNECTLSQQQCPFCNAEKIQRLKECILPSVDFVRAPITEDEVTDAMSQLLGNVDYKHIETTLLIAGDNSSNAYTSHLITMRCPSWDLSTYRGLQSMKAALHYSSMCSKMTALKKWKLMWLRKTCPVIEIQNMNLFVKRRVLQKLRDPAFHRSTTFFSRIAVLRVVSTGAHLNRMRKAIKLWRRLASTTQSKTQKRNARKQRSRATRKHEKLLHVKSKEAKTAEKTHTNVTRDKQIAEAEHSRRVAMAKSALEEASSEMQKLTGSGRIVSECVVCLEHDADYILIPCGHQCVCKKCAELISVNQQGCPVCRKHIDLFTRVYS